MEEKIQKEEGISLMDILQLLLSKIKLLILVVIIGGILGGSFAVWRTVNIDYYGTEVQFYVNPERPKQTASSEGSQYGVYGAYGRHVMDNMVKLLGSESFTEQLILDGRTIPKQSTDEKPWKITIKNPESEAEIEQKNKEFNKKLNASIEETELLLNDATAARNAVTAAKKIADEALEQVQEAWLAIVPSLPDISNAYWSYSDIAYTHLQTKLPAELKTLCEDYQSKKLQAKELQAEADLAVEIAENKTEETLALWRTTNNYKADLNLHSGKISYSYLEANADTDDANNLARSFIYVKISVLVDSPDKEVKEKQREFANDLYEKVIKVVPSYVEANMAVPSDYEGTNCQRITRTDEIHLTNPLYTTNQAIKYAVLFAAAAAVIAAVLIIIVDRSDKRLRDQETITRLFNVPVLGIVPTIEDLTTLSATKKKERAKRSVLEKKEKAKQLKEKEKQTKKDAEQAKKQAELQAKQEKQTKSAPAPAKQQTANNKKKNGSRR